MSVTKQMTRYPLDLTGKHPDNKVVNERYIIDARNPVFKLSAGAFYTDSVVITHLGEAITPRVDFTFTRLVEEAVKLSNQDVAAFITLNDRSLSGEILITYQAVGGEFQNIHNTIVDILENYKLDKRGVFYNDVVNLPTAFVPVRHLHSIYDIYGLNPIADPLNELVKLARTRASKIDNQTLFRLYKLEEKLKDLNFASADLKSLAAIKQEFDLIKVRLDNLNVETLSAKVAEVQKAINERIVPAEGKLASLESALGEVNSKITQNHSEFLSYKTEVDRQLAILNSATTAESTRQFTGRGRLEKMGLHGFHLTIEDDPQVELNKQAIASINTAITGLSQRIGEVDSKENPALPRLSKVEGDIKEINGKLKGNDTTHAKFTSDISDLTRRVGTVETNITSINSSIDETKRVLRGEINQAIGDLNRSQSTLQTTLNSQVESKLTQLETKLNGSITSAVNSAKTALEATSSSHATRLQALEQKDVDHDSQLAQVKQQLEQKFGDSAGSLTKQITSLSEHQVEQDKKIKKAEQDITTLQSGLEDAKQAATAADTKIREDMRAARDTLKTTITGETDTKMAQAEARADTKATAKLNTVKEALTGTIGGHTTKIDALENKARGYDTALQSINQTITDQLTNKAGSLLVQMGEVRGQLVTVNQTLTQLGTDITSGDAAVKAALEQKVNEVDTKHSGKTAELETSLTRIEKESKQRDTAIEEKFKTLTQSGEATEGKLAEYWHKTDTIKATNGVMYRPIAVSGSTDESTRGLSGIRTTAGWTEGSYAHTKNEIVMGNSDGSIANSQVLGFNGGWGVSIGYYDNAGVFKGYCRLLNTNDIVGKKYPNTSPLANVKYVTDELGKVTTAYNQAINTALTPVNQKTTELSGKIDADKAILTTQGTRLEAVERLAQKDELIVVNHQFLVGRPPQSATGSNNLGCLFRNGIKLSSNNSFGSGLCVLEYSPTLGEQSGKVITDLGSLSFMRRPYTPDVSNKAYLINIQIATNKNWASTIPGAIQVNQMMENLLQYSPSAGRFNSLLEDKIREYRDQDGNGAYVTIAYVNGVGIVGLWIGNSNAGELLDVSYQVYKDQTNGVRRGRFYFSHNHLDHWMRVLDGLVDYKDNADNFIVGGRLRAVEGKIKGWQLVASNTASFDSNGSQFVNTNNQNGVLKISQLKTLGNFWANQNTLTLPTGKVSNIEVTYTTDAPTPLSRLKFFLTFKNGQKVQLSPEFSSSRTTDINELNRFKHVLSFNNAHGVTDFGFLIDFSELNATDSNFLFYDVCVTYKREGVIRYNPGLDELPQEPKIDMAPVLSKVQSEVRRYIAEQSKPATSDWNLANFRAQPAAEDWSSVSVNNNNVLHAEGVILQRFDGGDTSVFAPAQTFQITKNQEWSVPKTLVGRKAEITVRAKSRINGGELIHSAVRRTFITLPEGTISILAGELTSFGTFLTVNVNQDYPDALTPRFSVSNSGINKVQDALLTITV